MNFYSVNGFLNVYKEAGWTSMDVCAKLKHITGVRRIGHAGTLDPMAEGVLPVAIGRASKDIDSVGGGIKEYTAGMLLGTVTDTQDITGQKLKEYSGPWPSEEEVKKTLMSYVGDYDQLTPMYSARKVNGKKLYEYARAGKEVERKTKKVSIYSIHIDSIDLPHVTFTVQCSRGTYIRTLCEDAGNQLGCGACMESLTRNQVGKFRIEDSVKISEIKEMTEKGKLDNLLSIAAPTAISIGKFDGTHIGHQALFRELRKTAEKQKLRTLVLILKFGKAGVLSDEERKNRLYELGIDYCVEMEFTEELKNMTAEEFLEKILIGRFHMKAIVAGKDVSFGRGKAGNAEFLYANAEKYGYTVDLIDKLKTEEHIEDKDDEIVVSSTLLRSVLGKGDMKEAARLLGTPYTISGKVVHGKGLASSEMKYATMNIEVPDELTTPPYGVYAVRARIYENPPEGRLRKIDDPEIFFTVPGIANLGERPTVNGSVEGGTRIRLEVHAFEDIGDCYGKKVRVELIDFIRPEKKFENLSELMKQILEKDVPEARKSLEI